MWHDDGTVKDDAAKAHAMYQRPDDNNALSYQEAAQITNTDSQAAATAGQQIPTPGSAAISAAEAALLDAAVTEATVSDPAATAVGAQTASMLRHEARAVNGATALQTASPSATSRVENQQGHAPSEAAGADIQQQAAALPSAASDSAQPQPASDVGAAAAAAHITQLAEPSPAAVVDSISRAAKVTEPHAASVETAHAQEAAPDTVNVTAPATDTQMADGNSDAALNASAVPDQPQPNSLPSTAPPTEQAAGAGPTHEGSWKGPAKGPGLGDSKEFTGGPINFERPKYRHSPYASPAVRAGGRFLPAGGRGSPRGRDSPTGRSFGRGFSEPPRSVILEAISLF